MSWLKYMSVIPLLFIFGCGDASHLDGISGYVEAEYIYISALESGWIVASSVNQGDVVETGQVLFELDKDRQRFDLDEVKMRAAQAEAQYRDLATGARPDEINRLDAQRKEAVAARSLADVERRRVESLRKKGLTAQATVDKAITEFNAADARVDNIDAQIRLAKLASRENAVSAALAAFKTTQANVDRAQWRLEQRTVLAPRAGRVEQVYFRKGEQLSAGSLALALLPNDALKVRFFVPQSELPRFSAGVQLSIKQDGVAEPVSATVTYVASQAEYTPPVIYSVTSRQKLVFLIEARLPSTSGLHAGQPVDVFLQAASHD